MSFNPEYIILNSIQHLTVQMACDLLQNRAEQERSSAQAKADSDRAQAQFDFLKSQH